MEDRNVHDINTLVVDDNEGKEKQATIYSREKIMKPDRYTYIDRKGDEVDSSRIEDALQSNDKNKWDRAVHQELESLEAMVNGKYYTVYKI